MKKLNSFYLSALVVVSSSLANAMDDVDTTKAFFPNRSVVVSREFNPDAHGLPHPEFGTYMLSDIQRFSIVYLQKIVEIEEAGIWSRLMALQVISQNHKNLLDYVSIKAELLGNIVGQDDWVSISHLVRIYDSLGNQAVRNTYYIQWFNSWVGQDGNGPGDVANPNDALERLQRKGLDIKQLTDLLDLNPITVLNITDNEFVG